MVDDCMEMNIAGQVMLLLTRLGIRDAHSLRVYREAVLEAVSRQVVEQGTLAPDAMQAMIRQQLELLEASLRTLPDRTRARGTPPSDTAVAGSPAAAEVPASRNRRPSGYVPEARSMEEKLQVEREPIQQLLREDCVRAGLVDKDSAERLIRSMTGKTSADAELEIVEHLRQRLQDQVKSFIRKAKGGPWSDPRTQDDLRRDIHTARSVRSVLMMSRQVLKEYQTWEKEHGRHGILGLFSPRKKMAR
ncbi:MAG: hypothetical protein KDI88_14525 [Gammaproteobacteria bacterium]|nr:hypothetical protein [Gammaproteobacteria bacterium]